jgi:hypothetical protein
MYKQQKIPTQKKKPTTATKSKDDATFFYAQAMDMLASPHPHGRNRLADGRLILPLMLDLPRICPLRRCRRAKTCTDIEMPCAIEFHLATAIRRATRIETDPVWRQKRWARVTSEAGPIRLRRALKAKAPA